jgi:hypothetical protein
MTEVLSEQAHRVSAAELDLMCQAAATFLHSQGTTSRNSYTWPPERMHMDGGVAAGFRALAALSQPAPQPAPPTPAAPSDLTDAITAAELDLMSQAAVGFLESQGTAAPELYWWPAGRPHYMDAMGDFRKLSAHRGKA